MGGHSFAEMRAAPGSANFVGARPRTDVGRFMSLVLAVVVMAAGFVWAGAVADEVLELATPAAAVAPLIEPDVDSIYGSGSVTYTVNYPSSVESVDWYGVQGFERLFYFRFENRPGIGLSLVQVPWGSILSTIDYENCGPLQCTIRYEVTRIDKCMEDMDLGGVNYPELGVDLSFRIRPAQEDIGSYGYPNEVKVSAPLTGNSDSECPRGGVSDPPNNSYEFTIIDGDMTVDADDAVPGRYLFRADTYDLCEELGASGYGGDDDNPGDGPDCETMLFSRWQIDGNELYDAETAYTFDKPGVYPIVFEADGYNPETDASGYYRADGTLTLRAPEMVIEVEAQTASNGRAKAGEEFDVEVSARTTKGVGDLSQVAFNPSTGLVFDPGLFELISAPSLPAAPLTAAPQTEFFTGTWRLKAIGDGDGSISATMSGVGADGKAVTGSREAGLRVGDPLQVSVVVDPATVPKSERENGEPVEVNVTITAKNDTDRPMTTVALRSFGLDRVVAGQPVSYELIDPNPVAGGVIALTAPPDPISGLTLPDIGAGQQLTMQAKYRIDDDGEFKVSAQVQAAGHQGGVNTAVGEAALSVAAEKYLEFRTTVVSPTATDKLLDAGQAIWVTGTIKNVTTTASIEVGPPYAQTSGNAGAQTATWDRVGVDATQLTPIGTLVLAPGEEQEFTTKVVTSWSDPRPNGGVNPSGGTRAYLEFTPWGRATEADGSVTVVTPDLIDTTDEDLNIQISIDDSIAIPTTDHEALAAGILIGTLDGTISAGAAIVMGIPDVFIGAYSMMSGATEYQRKIWDSFTEVERDLFVDETSFMILSVLQRNYEFAEQDSAELLAQINASVLGSMTELSTAWETGDYVNSAQVYSKYTAEAIGSVALPVAFTKLAKTPRAAAILARAQAAIQARLAPLAADIARISRLDDAARILRIIEAGAELTPDQISKLYGISPAELAELQRLADKYGLLLTVRSRHPSSIEWIEKFGAMLKPESLKLKTVSDLDAKLGFDPDDVGSLVFRKPEALVAHEAGESLGDAVNNFVTSKGFTPGTPEWENAVARTVHRADEWKRFEQTYKQWSKNGKIDAPFDYDANGVPTGIIRDADQTVHGFRLVQRHADGDLLEDYLVEMFDINTGTWKRVTGDIDPIAFTHTDGSPLDAWLHADLLDDMRNSPLLRAAHGESATFLGGGVDFIARQFKPLEAALQLAPNAIARVVRFNPTKSRWNDPFDYNLFWDGGFVESSAPKITQAQSRDYGIPVVDQAAYEAAIRAPKRPLKLDAAATAGGGANLGRCRVGFASSAGTAPTSGVGAVFVDELGALQQVQPDGSSAPSNLAQQCFVETDSVIDIDLLAITQIVSGIVGGGFASPRASRAGAPSTLDFRAPATLGATTLTVVDTTGFAPGDLVAIGVGTPDVEVRTLVSVEPFVIDAPLQRDHGDGALVAALASAGDEPPTTSTTEPAPTTTEPVSTPSTTEPVSTSTGPTTSTTEAAVAAGGPTTPGQGAATPSTAPTTGGTLPFTGSSAANLLLSIALTIMLLGAVLLLVRRRRHHDGDESPPPQPTMQ